MQLGIYDTGRESAGGSQAFLKKGGRLSGTNYRDAMGAKEDIWTWAESRLQVLEGRGEETRETGAADGAGDDTACRSRRSEASKIYEAAVAGKGNPINNLRSAPKVPYGYLAKDGVITYNGVTFVCDERTNSICLGNMEDKSQVITVTLSGGGHLKVNRSNIGDLAKAAGMFSPEDLNLIMRAIAQDTKIQSVEKEIDDMENGIGSAESAVSGEGREAEEQV